MENDPFCSHIFLTPISEVRTHKQTNNLFLLDSSLRERELSSAQKFKNLKGKKGKERKGK
jgi:hypothetical protein